MAVAYYELLGQEDISAGVGTFVKRNPGGGSLTTTQVGIHTLAEGQTATSATWNPGEVAAGGSQSTTVSVASAALGDFVLASFSLDLAGLTLSSYVSSTNTVTIVLTNLTGSAIDLASGTVRVLVLKSI